jgi:hypothetical protein
MAVKTFTSGEVLTASDTNTYLANSGLVYVTSTSFTTATSVNVNNCYTSTFTNYRIVVRISGTSNGWTLYYRERLSGTDAQTSYSHVGQYFYLSAGSQLSATTGAQAQAQMTVGVVSGANARGGFVIDVFQPQLAVATSTIWQGGGSILNTGWASGAGGGAHYVNTAYDGFTLFPSNDNMTGELTVYGYRKA